MSTRQGKRSSNRTDLPWFVGRLMHEIHEVDQPEDMAVTFCFLPEVVFRRFLGWMVEIAPSHSLSSSGLLPFFLHFDNFEQDTSMWIMLMDLAFACTGSEGSETDPARSCSLTDGVRTNTMPRRRRRKRRREKGKGKEEPTWQPSRRPLCRLSQSSLQQENLVGNYALFFTREHAHTHTHRDNEKEQGERERETNG